MDCQHIRWLLSLKKIANKLEDVDRKTTVALDKKGKKKVKEEPTTNGGRNEKRKRDFGSLVISRSRSKSRSKNASGKMKMRPLRINISDDEDSRRDKTRENSHVDEKLEINKTDVKQLDEIKGMLQALMTGLNQSATSKGCARSETTVEDTSSGKGADEPVASDEAKKDKGRAAEMQSEVLEYMRCRLDYYMTKTYKEIKALCKSRNARCERKDKGAWELVKHDTDQYTKLVNNTKEDDDDPTDEDDDDENAADGEGEGFEDEDNDEVIGN
ncbi:hypothetical protein CBR_g44474 [Chara braunii]|uniref:Uncharacterized protein n=1 Tax=Chara braunii TaxID=69332 RepID=A0A388LXG8_CHABU|nr:hypothetical protein CBR_g44474 [Chara braunii]|eukprot:GBG87020.1 hypothetical protein CBR_g44474 [Chara braunii]